LSLIGTFESVYDRDSVTIMGSLCETAMPWGSRKRNDDAHTPDFNSFNQAANDLSLSIPIRVLSAGSQVDGKLLEMIHKKS